MKINWRTVLNHPIIKIVLGAAICFLLFIVAQNFIIKPFLLYLIPSEEIAKTIANYISSIVLLLSYFFLFRTYEQRKVPELSLKHLPKEFFGGLFFGFLVISLIILLLYLLGYYSILNISNYQYFLKPLSILVGAALIEEIFFRGILYRVLEEWKGTFIALFITAFLFELPHTFNENATFLSFLLGVVFGLSHGLMFTYTKRIWLPFAFHLGWNLAQPFYGSNLSGLEDMGLVINAKFEGPKIFIGSNYGIEDSIFSLLLLGIICLFFLYLSIKNGKIIGRNKTFKNTIKL